MIRRAWDAFWHTHLFFPNALWVLPRSDGTAKMSADLELWMFYVCDCGKRKFVHDTGQRWPVTIRGMDTNIIDATGRAQVGVVVR